MVACYIPPNYTAVRGSECLDHITDLVLELKRKYVDPYLVVTGDFNQWNAGAALADYGDVREMDVGPTRNARCLDKVFVNFGDLVRDAGTHCPLESLDAVPSDHRMAYVRAELPRFEKYEMLTYSYRLFTDEAADAFSRWITLHDWTRVLQAQGSNCLLYTSPSPRD